MGVDAVVSPPTLTLPHQGGGDFRISSQCFHNDCQQATTGHTTAAAAHREVYFSDAKKPLRCPVYQRDSLKAGARIVGPALVQEHGTTTVLFRNDDCRVMPSGELIIRIGGA